VFGSTLFGAVAGEAATDTDPGSGGCVMYQLQRSMVPSQGLCC